MGMQVCAGAMMMCSFGAAPSSLVVIRPKILAGAPAANIMDYAPCANVPPFALCMSIANPAVAAATAAALGVLTPMPCVPVTVAPWVPGKPAVLVGGMPALDSSSKLMCAWGGVISISAPGQFKTVL